MLLATHNQKSGLFWLIAGIIISYVAAGYGIGTPREPGPGYIAFLMGLVICLLSAILILQDLRSRVREPLSQLFRGNMPRVLCTLLALLVYTVLLPYLGFCVDSVLLLYGLILLSGNRNHPVAGGIAVAVSVGSYYLFARVLQTSLPVGVLGEWIFGGLP
ncbi:MAG: tripartite tricarboxylate transporter TctB family protein [Desulfomonile tiedjei]|nr:tripartite tricarboxylate transporter TctB family protein [Desulfomonile tiedjei]